LKNPRLLAITFVMIVTPPSSTLAQELPRVRQLGRILTKSAQTVPSIASARELPETRVLVNDIVARRLYLFDSALTSRLVLLDSGEVARNAYGGFPGGMIAYRADSTLFVDPSFAVMRLIDPAGKVARSFAGPNPGELLFLAGGPFGAPGFDARRRLLYRGSARDRTQRPASTLSPYPEKDSAPILRLDLNARRTDTVAFVRIPKVVVTTVEESDGRFKTTVRRDPLPTVDDWTVLPDGSLALIRGGDFHIDWIDANGKRSSSARIPFPWRGLTSEAKAAFMDSVRYATDTAVAAQKIRLAERFEGTGIEPPEPMEPEFVSAGELPANFPAFEPNSTHADPYGVLWIRTTQRLRGEPVYYLVDRKGTVIDRVQLPPRRTIAGFGRNHTIYLASVDPAGGVRLERAQMR
jgi:hypothetical protein